LSKSEKRIPRTIKMGRYSIPLPQSRALRIALGVVLVLFGFVGFLPILGFWMVPLGFFVLSIDIPIVGRWWDRVEAWAKRRFGPWWKRRVEPMWTRLIAMWKNRGKKK
jgi:hypothetical protein